MRVGFYLMKKGSQGHFLSRQVIAQTHKGNIVAVMLLSLNRDN